MVDSVIPYLNEVITIEENFTLGDFFKILQKGEEIMDYVFASYLGHNALRPFIEEIQQKYILNNEEELEYIECSWVTDQFDYRLFYKHFAVCQKIGIKCGMI